MEWSIAKQIDSFVHNSTSQKNHLNFTTTPAKTFTNPGVGGSINIYRYYVPIYSKNPLQVQKQVEPEKLQVVQQSGTGVEDKVDDTTSVDIESDQEIPSNPQAAKMNPKIYNSFQHPSFVKTDKILFDLKRKGNEVKTKQSKKLKIEDGGGNSAQQKHKFQFY